MSTNFPTSLDTLTNPTGSDSLSVVNHANQHANANDAIEALEAKVGADSSAVTSSHDYKLSGVTGSDKAVSKTGTETLTNKTLTAPVINVGSDATGDTYYRNASGAYTRLAIGSTNQIYSVSSGGVPEWVANPSAADASTTVKGVSEEATLAETLARTTTGGTSARLYVSPANLTTVQTYDYAASASGNDTYAITVTPAPVAYVTGQTFKFKADVSNTGAATLNVNGLGAKTIKKDVTADLATGDIIADQVVTVIYDGTNFQIQIVKNSISTGNATRASGAGTGTQDIAHGLGVVPRLVKITSVGFYSPSGTNSYFCYGTATAVAAQSCTWSTVQTSSNQAPAQDTSNVIHFQDNTGTRVIAAISVLDSTNITLNFTTMTASSCYIQWEAYA